MSSPPASDDLAPVDVARSLCASGRAQEAIELLTAVNRSAPDRALEEELVRLRHLAFDQLPLGGATGAPIVPAPDGPGLLEREPAELSLELVGADLARHGCVLVRGLLGADQVARLVDGIDRAFDAFDAGLAGAPVGDTSPWYAPFTPQPGRYRIGGRKRWMRDGGGMWTADSPRMLFELLELFDGLGAAGAHRVVPRRAPGAVGQQVHPAAGACHHQHQLAPGRRLPRRRRAEPERVDGALPLRHRRARPRHRAPPPRPRPRDRHRGRHVRLVRVAGGRRAGRGRRSCDQSSAPGDALLFDHLFLHRTGVAPGMTRERYAIESWFFAPSSYPEGQIPIVF